jgi:hypothetical protein
MALVFLRLGHRIDLGQLRQIDPDWDRVAQRERRQDEKEGERATG